MFKMYKLLLCLSFFTVDIKAAKILGVFPTPSISHQVVFRPLMQELAKRGHEVTVITPDPAFPKGQTPENFTEIDVHDVSYDHWQYFLEAVGKEKNVLAILQHFADGIKELVEKQLQTPILQEFIRDSKKFDLLFIESCIRPAFIFSHIFKAPVIEFGSLGGVFFVYDIFGAESHPLIYPDVFHRRIYNLTIWEKISELYNHYSYQQIFKNSQRAENKMLKEIFGPDTPNLEDLRRNFKMLFLNTHPIWDFNRPVPPNVVYLGGMHQKPQRDLPQDLKSYLDSSTNGVIYVSFGTNVKSSMFSEETIKMFTDVFSKLPYDVLWKWDKNEIPGHSKNIRILEWLPQSDLLRHSKIKLFITQGGLQSTDEAITAGVPLVGIPMFADQWFNVEQYLKLNIGKRILIEEMTESELMKSITEVIDDKSYRDNIVKLRNIMNDQPQKPLERAVWWTEYVLRHGEQHMQAPGACISWTEYYELELVLLLIVAIVLVLILIALVIYFIMTISCRKMYKSTKPKTN